MLAELRYSQRAYCVLFCAVKYESFVLLLLSGDQQIQHKQHSDDELIFRLQKPVKMGNVLNSFNCDYQALVENVHRNTLSSIGAAFLFFIGWWIILDVAAANYHDFSNGYYTCGVLGSIAFFMINSVTNAQLRDDGFTTEGCLGGRGVKLWLFFGIVLGFSSLISAIWILFGRFLFVTSTATKPAVWPGIALFLHNFMIFLSTYVYKLGRSEELW